MDFEPKQFGKYYLLEKLAVGGMAEIYKAKTFGVDGFEKELAIKRILPHCSADKDFISMLIDEAKLSVMLSHANIVQVYDLGKVGDDYFISMEFIHGVNLRDIMYHCREKKFPIPPELAVYIASEICKGLDYAHRKTDQYNQALNIVHRDVSPQNVLISYEGEVKIVDFGIAKAAMNISHTMAGILKGKIAYMSPEQAMGKAIDKRTDIFSVGILLYEMLTGTKLFTGETQFEVLKKIRSALVTVETLPNSIPEQLKPTLARALSHAVEERFQNAGDLQIELTRFLYSQYSDFSPRKLSAFITEIFTDELKKEQQLNERERSFERQTSSVSFPGGVKQVEIVHRDIPASIKDDTLRMKAKKESSIQTAITEARSKIGTETTGNTATVSRSAMRKKRFWAAALSVVILAAASFAAYKFAPQIRFWENRGEDFRALPATGLPPSSTDKPPDLPSAATGSINFITDPSGAAILLDGKATGLTTPATLEKLPLFTDQHIILSKPDHEDFEQVVNLTTSRPQKISTKLKPLVPQNAKITITSMPAGAAVIIDGKPTGRTTPATIANLEPKTYTVGLSLPGYEDWRGEFNAQAYETLPVDVKLTKNTPENITPPTPAQKPTTPDTTGKQKPPVTPPTTTEPAKKETPKKEEAKITEPAKKETPVVPPPPKQETKEKEAEKKEPEVKGGTGKIKVSSSPSGADVFINGDQKGKTPMTVEVPSGMVSVLVNKEGLLRFSKQVNVKPGQTVDLTDISLTGEFGEVTILSDPPKAAVTYDNQQMPAPTPVIIKKVKRNAEHTITVKLSGFHAWTRTFTMDEPKKSFKVTLQPE